MFRSVFALTMMMSFSAPASAAEFRVGDEVKGFALRAVNPDVIGEKVVAIDDFYGAEATDRKKAIVLSFFATYCEPCKQEMPFLAAMHDEYSSKGLSVMSVSIDKEPEKIESLRSLAEKNAVKFPVLSDRFNLVAKRYFVEKLPLVYLINGDGRIAMVQTGYTESTSKDLFEEVRRLVGEPATSPVPASISKHFSPDDALAPLPSTPAADAAGGASDEAAPATEAKKEIVAAEDAPVKKKRKKRKKRRRRRKAK